MKTLLRIGALLLSAALPGYAFAAPNHFELNGVGVEQVGNKGPAVIFIPGLASGAWTWEDTVKRLDGKYRVYLLTVPGFDGRSPVPGTNLESLQAALKQLIDTRKLERPVLVGHSLGGTLSLAFAAKHPDAIAGVIAVDGLPVFPGTEAFTERKPLADRARAHLGGLNRESFAAEQLHYMKTTGVLDEALAVKLAEYSSRSDIATTTDFAAELLLLDLRPELPKIAVPVVEISPFHAPDFAAMGVDEARKTGYYRMLLDGVKQLEVVSISPARHFAMFDQPERFSAELEKALTRMTAKASTQ